MKNVLTAFVLCLTTVMVHSQIKNTSISKKTFAKKTISPGISVQNLQKTSISELNKMPAIKLDPKILTIKPSTSWKITPTKLRDKDLYITEFFGEYSPNSITIRPEMHYSGGAFHMWKYLKLKFRAEVDAEYRVKIKLAPGRYSSSNGILAMVNGTHNKKWSIDDGSDEIFIVFRGMRDQEVWISNMYDEGTRDPVNHFKPLEIKSINIDKIGS